MKLPYLPVPIVLKPVVEVTVLGARPVVTRALVDSGADISIFDTSVAAYTGTAFDPQLQRRVSGVGGTIAADGAWVDVMVAKRRGLRR